VIRVHRQGRSFAGRAAAAPAVPWFLDGCSGSPLDNIFASGASYRYQGLHIALDKRFSAGWQAALGSALSRNTGFIDGGFTSYDDHRLAYGNMPDHRRHRLTLSGVWAPRGYSGRSKALGALLNAWTISIMSQTFSRSPLNTLLNGYGQPSARVGQAFGTGGPRAFQFAARLLF
jgi:hypothetical protein